MKSFDNLDKNIDKYYEGSLDTGFCDESELKSTLDMMSVANEIEKIVSIPTDVSSIIEKGQEIRIKNKVRKETFKFLPVAILFTMIIGFIAINSSLAIISIIQFGLLILLLGIGAILQVKGKRSEQN